MTDMLKKAALAACEVTELYGREDWVVRAVLLSIREPDRDMIWAGNDEDGYYADGTQFNAECAIHWSAMIDAILKEGGDV